ncbi:hypothetical protein IIA16_06790 [bacterium]|nr:hypothetical protein [bacterium]
MARIAVSPSHNRDYDRGADTRPSPRGWALVLADALVIALWAEGHEPFLVKIGDSTVSYRRRRQAALALGADLFIAIRPAYAPDGDRGARAEVPVGADPGLARVLLAAGARALGVPARAVSESGAAELRGLPAAVRLVPANLASAKDRHAALAPGQESAWARAVAGALADSAQASPPPAEGDWEVWVDGDRAGSLPGLLEGDTLWVPAHELLAHSDLALAGLERRGRRLLLTWRRRPWWSIVGSGDGSRGEIELALFAGSDGTVEDGVFTLRGKDGSALTLEVDGGRVRSIKITLAATGRDAWLALDLRGDLAEQRLAGRVLVVKGRVAVSARFDAGEEEIRVSHRGAQGQVEAAWSPSGWELRATVRL